MNPQAESLSCPGRNFVILHILDGSLEPELAGDPVFFRT